ncbi:MAG: hypothetical protein IT292_05450 [Deltaproteobacteria bacterium]|nr:hypothetical protein [Deltaproteobacteria bacterium]
MKLILDYTLTVLLSVFVFILRKLSYPSSLNVAQFVISALLRMYPRFGKAAERNLELVFPEKDRAEREDIYRRSLRVLADNLVGYAKIPDLKKDLALQIFDYSDAITTFNKLRAEYPDVGLLICTAHYGNFELLVQTEALVNRPTAILARGFSFPRLNRWWNKRREHFGNQVFDRKGAYKQIERRLHEGQDVAILFDQNVKINHAVFVDLFGIRTATTKSVAIAAMRTKAPLVFTVSCVTFENRYKVFVEQVFYDDLANLDKEEQIVQITQRLNDILERLIRQHPDNWFWIHRRFKTREGGAEENIYTAA